MAALIRENEVATAISPEKMFKVFVLEDSIIIPKIIPVIKSIEIIEGNGGPGTIKKTTFVEGSEVKYVKNRIDAIDKDNFIHNYTTIEGALWSDTLEKISYEIKLVPASNGGSIAKSVSKYYAKGDAKIDEEQIKAGEQQILTMFKVIETYL
ncbi:major allergen Pru av 1 [Jatropha curcas]|nr:major allergen Pru av 1 [Jatropha curcas]